jgi:hypothetical protein
MSWSANASRKESKSSGSYWSSRKASALGSRDEDEDAVGLDLQLMKPLPRVYAGPERGRGSDEALTHWYSSSETNG